MSPSKRVFLRSRLLEKVELMLVSQLGGWFLFEEGDEKSVSSKPIHIAVSTLDFHQLLFAKNLEPSLCNSFYLIASHTKRFLNFCKSFLVSLPVGTTSQTV
ncbi:MAG: hypothetical protein KDA84_25900 [Planctomycetaceae bacterium]|nr:hypothetical protein [Planctomycetaceae bacterium]